VKPTTIELNPSLDVDRLAARVRAETTSGASGLPTLARASADVAVELLAADDDWLDELIGGLQS
jgi:hypothetical protein